MGQPHAFITAVISIIMLVSVGLASAAADETTITTRSRTILVAGATGPTGRHIVRKLLDRGYTVRAMSRSVERAAELGPPSNLSLQMSPSRERSPPHCQAWR